jgi:hypothetical protein
MAALSSDPASAMTFSSPQSWGEPDIRPQEGILSSQDNEPTTSPVQENLLRQMPQSMGECVELAKEKSVDIPESNSSSLPQSISMSRTQSSPAISNTETSFLSTTEGVAKSFSSTPGYLANRWNTANSSSSTPLSSQVAPLVTPPM